MRGKPRAISPNTAWIFATPSASLKERRLSGSTKGSVMTKNVGLRSVSRGTKKSSSSTSSKKKTSGASSRRGPQIVVNASGTGGKLKGKTDWARLAKMTDEDIAVAVAEDPDAAPILDETFWKNAIVVGPDRKTLVSFRLDRDVLVWFRSLGKGYQTRINAVLRSYMQAHKR